MLTAMTNVLFCTICIVLQRKKDSSEKSSQRHYFTPVSVARFWDIEIIRRSSKFLFRCFESVNSATLGLVPTNFYII